MYPHSNLFVKNIPTEINEAVLRSLFQTYGCVVSCRILKSRYRGSNNVGFVKFASLEEAQLAIQYMHLATIENVVIEVRFADQDVGERRAHLQAKASHEAEPYHYREPREGYPCRNLYIKGFPRQWRESDVMDFFSNFGTVISAKVLSSRESTGRSGAGLVMMGTVEEASIALRHVDGRIPLGGEVPMTLRYADSDVLSRGGRVKKERPSDARHVPYPMERPKKLHSSNSTMPLAPVLTQAAIQASNLCPVVGQQFKLERDDAKVRKPDVYVPPPGNHYASNSASYIPPYMPTPLSTHAQAQAVIPKQEEPQKTSLYIRNLPYDVSELRLYELFGQFGGIRSVKRLPDRDAKSRGGVGFVNYVDYAAASRATAEMNGVKIGNNVLIISLQVRPTYNH